MELNMENLLSKKIQIFIRKCIHDRTREQKNTNRNGQCTVKEASKFIYTHEGIQFDKILWNGIWKTPCPQKI